MWDSTQQNDADIYRNKAKIYEIRNWGRRCLWHMLLQLLRWRRRRQQQRRLQLWSTPALSLSYLVIGTIIESYFDHKIVHFVNPVIAGLQLLCAALVVVVVGVVIDTTALAPANRHTQADVFRMLASKNWEEIETAIKS